MNIPTIIKVIDNDFCSGCGVCATLSEDIKLQKNEYGYYKVEISNEARKNYKLLETCSRICPFTNESLNETEIGKELYGDAPIKSKYLGNYIKSYVGYVNENEFRKKGSSGGIGKWIASELFRVNEIDKLIQVKMNERNNPDEPLYSYGVFDTYDSIINGSKSAYYPVEMSNMIEYIKTTPGKYAITGVPCFIKALRLLQREDPVIKKRIRYTIGLVCGHLKSDNYANMIGWQLGVKPYDIKSLDFRKKIDGKNANEKGVEVKSLTNDELVSYDIVQNLFGTNYGEGFFKLKACDYCDDVVSETADISIGDAWLPEYVKDGKGNNVVIVRNPKIQALINQAIEDNRVNLTEISEEYVIASQDAGFRHRREGLAYRLYLLEQENQWYPNKRVKPSNITLNNYYKRIHLARIETRKQSHIKFNKALIDGDFDKFRKEMMKITILLKKPFWRRVLSKIKRTIFK